MKNFALRLLLPLLLTAMTGTAGIKTITVLQTSDLHCHFTPATVAGLGGIIQQEIVRAGGRDKVILLDSGDLIQGSFAAATGKGRPAINFLNYYGYDFWAPGNHDFDFGFTVLHDRVKQFKGQTIAANLEAPEKHGIAHFAIIRRDNLKIAVIGLTFPHLWREYLPDEPEFKLQNFAAALDRIMPKVMKEKPNIIIMAAHYGVSMSYSDKNNSLTEIARKYPQINFIGGGHTHQVNTGQDLGYGVWYVEPGKHGQGIMSTALTYDTAAERVTGATSKFITDPDDKKVVCPSELQSELKEYQQLEKVVIGQAAEPISGSSRGVSNPLQSLLAKAVCAATGAEYALISPSRDQLTLQGDITEKTLFELTPYDDTISVLEVTPEQLKELTSEQLNWKVIPQRQLPWGFYVMTDAKGKVKSIEMPGNPARGKIAISSFIVTRGKNWFPQLQKLVNQPENHLTDTHITIRNALRNHIRTASPLHPDFTKWLINP